MNYFVVGTNQMEAATQFYDELFAQAGLVKMTPAARMTYWLGEDFAFALAIPFDGEVATAGNGTMVGFSVGSAEEVTRLYHKALALGGVVRANQGREGRAFLPMCGIWIAIRSACRIELPLTESKSSLLQALSCSGVAGINGAEGTNAFRLSWPGG